MKLITFKEAEEQGYRSITADIWPERDDEKHIVASVESTMEGCDAVWIAMSYGALQCGRKRSELILSEDVTRAMKGQNW